jgi:hypothetical protein
MVVGSGRSGTSVLSSVLRELGYRVPQPEVKADKTNPMGFGEPQWLVDFHTAALRDALVQTTDARPEAWADTAQICLDPKMRNEARTWLAKQFNNTEFVLLKDPRLLWFTTLWDIVADDLRAEPIYLTMLRPPADVVKSKDFWYNMPLSATNRAAGWVNTMLYTERATRGKKRAYVSFEKLLNDWTQTVGKVDAKVGLPPVAGARSWTLVAAEQIVDPSLARSHATWDQLGVSPAISDMADRVWEKLQSFEADGGEDEKLHREFDELRIEYRVLYQAAEDIAQSSVLAANRRGVAQGKASRGGGHSKPARAARPATEPVDEDGSRSRSLRVARLIPESVRHALPLGARQKLLKRLP